MGKQKQTNSSSSAPKATPVNEDNPFASVKTANKGPRARIVKSGNSGNSASSTAVKAVVDDGRPPPLFPVGYKTPLSLLNERCQKNGWQKPDVQPFKNVAGYSCVVRLTRIDPKNGAETVTFRPSTAPDSPEFIDKPTSLEAKHWASVYALHRFASGLQLGMILPPQCREYWTALQAEKKAAQPKEAAFLYAEDPFAAQAAKDASKKAAQASRTAAAEQAANGALNGQVNPTAEANKSWPEVKLGQDIRKMMQDTIRQMRALYPPEPYSSDSDQAPPFVPDVPMRKALLQDLIAIGYREGHVNRALDYISSTSSDVDPLLEPLSATALQTSNPAAALKETVLQYLQITLAEEELPVNGHGFQGRPDAAIRIARKGGITSSANTTPLSGRSGTSTPVPIANEPLSLADTWLVERMSKEAGFPIAVLEDAIRQGRGDEALTLTIASRRLVGWKDEGWSGHSTLSAASYSEAELSDIQSRRATEVEALNSMLGDACRLKAVDKSGSVIEIHVLGPGVTQHGIFLRVLLSPSSPYPSKANRPNSAPGIPVFYIASENAAVPPYLRLHLLSLLLERMRDPANADWLDILKSGEGGIIYEMVNYLQENVAEQLRNPPPSSQILKHLFDDEDASLVGQITSLTISAKAQPKARPVRPRAPATGADHSAVKKAYVDLQSCAEYQSMLAKRKSLPAWQAKDKLVATIQGSRVVVVSGATGSGKTTQVPAYILENAILSGAGADASLICTQPRRISAIGVANRVADEHAEKVGKGLIGYAIRGERKASPDCRLLFCTTGVLLQRLSRGGDPELLGVSHVFVDEVHERSLDSDFLLLMLKEVLHRNKRIKVILMSATADSERFAAYFGGAPCIDIPGRTFPIEDFYLEDIISATNYKAPSIKASRTYTQDENDEIRSSFISQGITAPEAISTLTMLARAERIDYDLIAATVKHIIGKSSPREAILIFVTGVAEITQSISAIEKVISRDACDIMPLHANLSSSDQSRVFRSTQRRKVIVATNVAETSITIDDVVYVIDCGRVKETRYDAVAGLQRLVEDWNSLAGSRQRRGRSGRTKPGQCWKLYTQWQEARLPAHSQPEILRTPLASLLLQVKAIRGEQDVAAFLGGALDAPSTLAIEDALSVLERLGALVSGDPRMARLTPLGHNLALLPLDLRLGKMLILAYIFGCLDPVLTLCASLSSKPIFTSPMEKRDEATAARTLFTRSNSDLLTDLAAMDAAARVYHQPGKLRMFCEDHFISSSAVRDIISLRTDYISALRSAGFTVEVSPLPKPIEGDSQMNMIKAIIYAGTARAVRVKLPQSRFESTITGSTQIDHEAKEVRFFDDDGRVFIHPASVLFHEPKLQNGYLTYFNKSVTSKPFLRDATELPLSALLMFGRNMKADALKGGLSINDGTIRLRAPPRTSVLVNELRRLLDVELAGMIDNPDNGRQNSQNNPVMRAIRTLLERDA